MKAAEARMIAKQWADEHVAHLPGFHGAYLAGGIIRTADDETFPHYVDVDVHVILDRPWESGQRQGSFLYRDVIIECYFVDKAGYESWEGVVSNPLESQSFRSPNVISDPTGSLTEIQTIVAREFTRRKWVEARCGTLRQLITSTLDDEAKSSSISHMLTLLSNIPYLLANAHLKNPTNRRAYCQTREILHADDRADLHESILALHGFTDVSREETEIRLQECIRAFDRAVEVFKTPFWSDHRMNRSVRPYILEGSQEMIREGRHREAMPWIVWNHMVANVAIQNDAPEDEKKQFRETYDRLYGQSNTWYGKPFTWPTKEDTAFIRRVVADLLKYVDETLASNPAIREE